MTITAFNLIIFSIIVLQISRMSSPTTSLRLEGSKEKPQVIATLKVEGTKDKIVFKSKHCSKTNEMIYILFKKRGSTYRSSIKFTRVELLMFFCKKPATYTNGYKKFSLRVVNDEILLAFYVYDRSKLEWHLECTMSFTENNLRELVDLIISILYDNKNVGALAVH